MSDRVRVAYMGLLRNTLGCSEEEVELPAGSRVKDVLAVLQERHGADFRDTLFTGSGQLRDLVQVFIGDQSIEELEGVDTEIEPTGGVYLLLLAHHAAGG